MVSNHYIMKTLTFFKTTTSAVKRGYTLLYCISRHTPEMLAYFSKMDQFEQKFAIIVYILYILLGIIFPICCGCFGKYTFLFCKYIRRLSLMSFAITQDSCTSGKVFYHDLC